ncbi:methyltransferase domain-containing protein [Rhizorhapis suberifaciens]|uniref:SAM-dependent methyltransferase n=1 Tax=Rhizorhapis suberifaciens TaxID=13656 RepID=A0A840HT28_9SPHN|nr:methyltransferase domain-containing protein [Rhizorhapis suberifaciens]MBB4640767.1 SAM-dependent methyltransferase [Rhizorhapis suberifaciens]
MRQIQAEEQMDAPDLPESVYAKVLAGLGRVNAATLAARPTLNFLKRTVRKGEPFRLLDVGFGDGGMLRSIHRWSRRRGYDHELVGIDLNLRSEAVARARHPKDAPISYRTGDYADLANEHWDFIISSLVTHHMDDEQRHAFLLFMEGHAARGWFVNDLHRHAFSYYGFPLLARLLAVHRIVRQDGQLSIARSFEPGEWALILDKAGLGEVTKIRRYFPFRLCVERIR